MVAEGKTDVATWRSGDGVRRKFAVERRLQVGVPSLSAKRSGIIDASVERGVRTTSRGSKHTKQAYER